MALKRFACASEPITVHGRIAPVNTTGLWLRTVRSAQ
jgi:hypothetical protein